jgi:hypothetical protein
MVKARLSDERNPKVSEKMISESNPLIPNNIFVFSGIVVLSIVLYVDDYSAI